VGGMTDIAYYAVPDPDDAGRMVYLRRNARGALDPWPAKAKYGPSLLKKDVPDLLKGVERSDWIRQWFSENSWPWWATVRQAVADDPVTAQARFAKFCSRCCFCGKRLTDEASKTYGVGPECRRGEPAEFLAHTAEAIGRAHAEHVDAVRRG
jgi:hypothetical protein